MHILLSCMKQMWKCEHFLGEHIDAAKVTEHISQSFTNKTFHLKVITKVILWRCTNAISLNGTNKIHADGNESMNGQYERCVFFFDVIELFFFFLKKRVAQNRFYGMSSTLSFVFQKWTSRHKWAMVRVLTLEELDDVIKCCYTWTQFSIKKRDVCMHQIFDYQWTEGIDSMCTLPSIFFLNNVCVSFWWKTSISWQELKIK